jgi:hypothetical protein
MASRVRGAITTRAFPQDPTPAVPTGPDDPACMVTPWYHQCLGGPYVPATDPTDPSCAIQPDDPNCYGPKTTPPPPAMPVTAPLPMAPPVMAPAPMTMPGGISGMPGQT